MELQIIENFTQLSDWNKDTAMKNALAEVGKYKGLVVTPETKIESKKIRAEIRAFMQNSNDLGIKVEKASTIEAKKMRKELKEVLDYVSAEFEVPIDNQIKAIEDDTRQKKRDIVTGLIATITIEYKLDKKHAPQLTLDESYLKESMKIPKITTDLKNRAEVLKVAQDVAIKNRELIISTCELHKETVVVDADSYLLLLDSGREIFEIVNMINSKAQAELAKKQELERQQQQAEFEAQQKAQKETFEAEQRAREEAVRAEYEAKQVELQHQAQEPTPEPVVHNEPFAVKDGIYTNVLQISGTSKQMHSLHGFLTSNNFEFKKLK